MNPTFFLPKFRRIAPTLLPLIVGILIGVMWASGKTAFLTAQAPSIGEPPAPLGSQSSGDRPVQGQSSGDESAALGGQEGERVTVIQARPGRDVAGSGDLIGFSHVNEQGTQVITMVDAEKRWMAVYHVGSEGAIRLVSSREIAADFTLELNATPPLPDQIRRLQGLPPRSK